MPENLKAALAHVLWIGGGTDAGKTTIADQIAERHSLQVYHYDQYDFAQHYYLAHQSPVYRQMLNASLDDNWVKPTVEVLVERSLQSFRDRFPLVIEDLRSLPRQPMILAEGFGFTAELLMPLLSDMRQALWLIPTADFKRASMERRNKPSWLNRVSDRKRALHNFYTRDMKLAAHIQADIEAHGLMAFTVDGSQLIEAMVERVEEYFAGRFPK